VTVLLGALALAYAWSEVERVTLASMAHKPLLAALERLQARAARGEYSEIAADLDQLRRCWEAYAFGDGEEPEQFAAQIPAMGTAACRATGRVPSGAPVD
jgi:hypothetical protein